MFGEKRSDFVRVKSAMMKLWHHRGLCKVVALAQNVNQFMVKEAAEKEYVIQKRLWLFDNQLLVLQPWEENLNWNEICFSVSSI